MAISGPSSYLQTTDEFLTHWLVADTTLGVGNEIVLPGPVTRAGLQTRRDNLEVKRADVEARLNAQEIARGDVDIQKAALLLRANQFNDKVRALYSGSKWERALPNVPAITDGQGNFIAPLDDIHSLWLLMNADASIPDVTLLGAYTQALLATDLAALKAAYVTYNAAGTVITITLSERNDLQDGIYPILKNYRQNLPTYFAKGHALVTSLPTLTPAPGSTPDAVTASGLWIAAQSQAKLTWTSSSDANLLRYDIRFCSGPNYSTDNESISSSVLPGATLEFLTDTGLTSPGNVASFKVYVVTSTGNEKGSNTVTITRPVA